MLREYERRCAVCGFDIRIEEELQYRRLQSELESYFEDTTDWLVERVMGSDGDDSALGRG